MALKYWQEVDANTGLKIQWDRSFPSSLGPEGIHLKESECPKPEIGETIPFELVRSNRDLHLLENHIHTRRDRTYFLTGGLRLRLKLR
jgi:hypothetical protein